MDLQVNEPSGVFLTESRRTELFLQTNQFPGYNIITRRITLMVAKLCHIDHRIHTDHRTT
jgi:hypothetical protein